MQRELQAAVGNENYDGTLYVAPESVAAAVRLAVDTPANATHRAAEHPPQHLLSWAAALLGGRIALVLCYCIN